MNSSVIGRRSRYLLKKARERAHLLLGLVIAVANLDEVVAIISVHVKKTVLSYQNMSL